MMNQPMIRFSSQFSLWIFLAGCLGVLPFSPTLIAAENNGGPYIVHIADTKPGQTMVISGGGYNPETVQVIVHISGTLNEQRAKLPELIRGLAQDYEQGPPAPPSSPPTENTATLKPLRATAHSVLAELPPRLQNKHWPPGFLAIVWLKDGDQLSNPQIVNAPRAWFLLKSTSRPGEVNRVCGVNLQGDRYVPRYVFLQPASGGKPMEVEQLSRHNADGFSEPFHIQFRIPRDLPAGEYRVFCHNNSGRAYGFTEALPLTVTNEKSFREQLYSANEHGVVGDSVTDNLAALQKLIDQAGAEGGGVVFLPPGAYRISDTLQMREGVILRGAGRESTTVFYSGDPAQTRRQRWLISARDVHRTGFEDLSIRVAPPFDYAISYYRAGKPTNDCHIARCRIVDGMVGIHFGVRFEIVDCSFQRCSFMAHNLLHSWVHENEFTTGRLRGNPFIIWSSEHCTIEHNRSYGSSRGFVWQSHGVLGNYRNFIGANVAEETRLADNAGETFLFEGAGFRWWGRPEQIQRDRFTISEGNFQPNVLRNHFAVVTSGRGLGQYVRITGNSATEVILEHAWPVVIPESDSRITIMMGLVENIFCNNRDTHCDNSMMFFGAGMLNNRVIRNRSENSLGISVWSEGRAGDHKLVPDYYNQFEANVLEDQGNFWLTRMGDIRQTVGVRNLNNVFRSNVVTDARWKRQNHYGEVWEETKHGSYRPDHAAFWLHIGRSYERDPSQSPIWIDTLIEHNFVTRCGRGLELSEISGGTTAVHNTFFSVDAPILDCGQGTLALDNRFEQPQDLLPDTINKWGDQPAPPSR